LFPYLSGVRAGDRATEFGQRCRRLGIQGVTLHSYRYAWAKAVHRAYAKRALMKLPSLEDYEQEAAKKLEPAA
jgi:hypothetical protein